MKKRAAARPAERKMPDTLECVTTTSPACPKCQCTDRTNKESLVKRDIEGVTREGRSYTVVQWSYCNCCECGNRYRFIEYLRPASRRCETGQG